jgi:hypothetical protein
MKKLFVIAAGLTVLGAGAAGAQGGGLAAPVCTSNGTTQGNVAQDACQQAYDVYQFMAPQLGALIAGGNATLGQASTLGGLGHVSVGIRANAFDGALPRVDQFTQRSSPKDAPPQTLPSKSQFVALPTADAAIGLFGGLPLALTNVGGIDLLVSAAYVPTITQNNVTVTPKQSLQFGYGVRLGLLSESIIVPGVSLTYLKRDLPQTTIVGTATYTSTVTGPTTATLNVNNAKVNTSAWRLVASKNLLLFSLAAGAGQDKYDQSADISSTVSGTLVTVPPQNFSTTATIPGTSQSLTRTNYFLDASMNLILAKLTAEVGQVSGGTVNTYNGFQAGRADRSQTYFSAGIRFGI